MTFNFGSSSEPREANPPPVVARAPAALGVDATASHGVDATASHGAEAQLAPDHRVLLVGQPNVGKSVVFGALTGTYVTVSNYPGTTVEITRGRAKFGERTWEVIDTPGTHNLVPMSEDEAVTRQILVSARHDALVQVGDAKNLVRTLLLTLQIAELGVPFCLDLNMLDEARARGLSIDLDLLSRELGGVTVHASTATEGEGLDAVRAYLAAQGPVADAARLPLACAPRFPDEVEAAIADIEALLDGSAPVAKRAIATMLLAGERGVGEPLAAIARVSPEALRVAGERARSVSLGQGVPMFALLSRLRLARAQALVRMVQRRDAAAEARSHEGHVSWGASAGVAAGAALTGALVYDGALARVAAGGAATRSRRSGSSTWSGASSRGTCSRGGTRPPSRSSGPPRCSAF